MLLCLDSHYHFSQNFMNGEFSLMWGEADIDEEDLLGKIEDTFEGHICSKYI